MTLNEKLRQMLPSLGMPVAKLKLANDIDGNMEYHDAYTADQIPEGAWIDRKQHDPHQRDGWVEWIDIMSPPTWNETSEYRIKPQMVTKYRYAYSTQTFKKGYISESFYTDVEWVAQLVGSNVDSYTKLEWSAKEFEA